MQGVEAPITSKISNSFFMYSGDTKFIADIRENFPAWAIYSNKPLESIINIVNTITMKSTILLHNFLRRIPIREKNNVIFLLIFNKLPPRVIKSV